MFDIKHVYQDPVTATIIAVGAAAGGTAYSIDQQKAAERDQERASAIQRKIQDAKTQRERRKSVREARMSKANVEAGAQASGTSNTSSAVTGVGSIGTQLADNLSFLDQVTDQTNQISLFEEKASKSLRRAKDGEAVGSLAFQSASLFV